MKKWTLITMCFLALFAGCDITEKDPETPGKGEGDKEEQQQPAETVLDISVASLALDNDGNTKTFSIVANGDWTITNNSTWCKTDRTSGKGNAVVSVMAFPYEEYDDRSANLTVKSGSVTKVLAVTQKKRDALLLTQEKYTVDKVGETITVEVKSNLTYSVTIPSAYQGWIKEVKSPASKALVTSNKYFEIAPNTNALSREGIIVFKDNGSSLADTVHVFQAQYGELILLQDRYTLAYTAQTLSVELQTNVDYDVVIPAAASDWISLAAAPAVEKADVVQLEIKANPNSTQRSGEVIFKDRNGTLSDTLYLVQEGKVSKVYYSDITLKSVEEIKNFIAQGYTEVTGTVRIEIDDPDFTDLSAFANHQMTSIRGLTVVCPNLKSFQGLAGLEKIDYLSLTGNYPSLISFSGLEGIAISSVELGSYGENNTFRYLTTFQGLNGVKTLSALVLRGNFPLLRSFEGLENLTSISGYNGITLDGTFNSLTSFQGLNQLKSVSRFYFDGNFPALASFEGLENLTEITGQFYFYGTFDELTDFRGLENLKSIEKFELSSSANFKKLKNFSGLDKLEYIGDFQLRMGRTPNFQSLEGLNNLKKIGKDFDVYGFSSTIPSLSGLNNLTTVGGNVKISNCYQMTSLAGLNALKTVGGTIKINSCSSLLSIDGLGGLQEFPNALNGAKVLTIEYCPKLKNFCALSDEFLRYYDLDVSNCGYNPTREDLLNGNCSR